MRELWPRTDLSEDSIKAAEQFLLRHQDSDGLWTDYQLPPGVSTAWTTACVGSSLAAGSGNEENSAALKAATKALLSMRRSNGWGYNSSVAIDADTTAWVFRLLAKVKDPFANRATEYIEQFIAASGGVRTFRDPERFGRWAQEHADVTPVAGLALLECGGDADLIEGMRAWALAQQQPDGSWKAFWWSTDSYATARNLEFLKASGGIPAAVTASSAGWIAKQGVAQSSFEAAHQLIVASSCGSSEGAREHLATSLLAFHLSDGSWPSSSVLLVPEQWENSAGETVYEDGRRLMSTATALQALYST